MTHEERDKSNHAFSKQTYPLFPHRPGSDVLARHARHARHTGCMSPTSAAIVYPRTPKCSYGQGGKRLAIVNDDGCAKAVGEEHLDGGIPTWDSGVLHFSILCVAVSFRRHSLSLSPPRQPTSFPSQKIKLNKEPDLQTHMRARVGNRCWVSE